MATILAEIKNPLGINSDNLGFDWELLLTINSIKAELIQIGVIEFVGIDIEGETTWPEFDSLVIRDLVKQVMVLKTKEVFDPIPNETIASSITRSIESLEGRIMHEIDEVANAE